MPVLVLVSRRVEAADRDHGLPGNFDILRIGGLSQPQSRQFVAQLLGHTPPIRVIEQLHSRSNGNPMFLKELVRSLSRVHGNKLMDIEDLDASGIPLNIHELLAERVDELPGELRDLMRLASVLGDSFREEWFFQITPSHLSPRENLEELVARGMIEARFDAIGRVTLAFNPRVLREVVYDRLPDETRIEIHSRVIEFLESAPEVAAVDALEVPLMLAFHYESVEGNQGAAHYRHEAGEMFLDVYEYPPAIEQFRKALALLDKVGVSRSSSERLAVQASLLVAFRESGRLQDAQRIVEQLPPIEELPEDVHAELLHEVGLVGIESGGIEESEQRLTRLVEISREKADAKFEVKGMLGLAQLYEKQNQLSRAADVLLAVSEKVESMGQLDLSDPDDRKLYWTAYNQLGTLFIRKKDFQKAQQFLNTALNRAQQIEDHRGLVRVLSNLGALCLSIRDVRRARDYFQNAVKAAQGIGDLLNQSRIETNLGIAAMEQNDYVASKKHFKKARSIAEDIGWYEGLAELSRHIKRLKKAMGK
jgi:tetratricopeptide (TPR) repeat protein